MPGKPKPVPPGMMKRGEIRQRTGRKWTVGARQHGKVAVKAGDYPLSEHREHSGIAKYFCAFRDKI